jgi:hypothetical protein
MISTPQLEKLLDMVEDGNEKENAPYWIAGLDLGVCVLKRRERLKGRLRLERTGSLTQS